MRRAVIAALPLLLGLTPAQERGKEIYLTGQSRSGTPIVATTGERGTPFPAAIVPCVNCHSEDGRGKAEGGVRPADIASQSLSRSATVNARTRPAYDRAFLNRAIAMGYDSAGNVLQTAMPRYSMTRDDAAALLDYLQILGREPQPGITHDAIRIAVIGDDSLTAEGERIYGRRIDLVRERNDDVFARIDASPHPGWSVSAAERDRVPTIVVESRERPLGRWAFSMTASEDDQRAALLAYGRRAASHAVLVSDCRSIGAVETSSLVLMTSEAASRCSLAAIPSRLDRRIVVAAPFPPDPAARREAARAALTLTTTLLAQLGHNVTQSAFAEALAQQQKTRRAAWLMTLDLESRRMVSEPGWVEGEAVPGRQGP